MKPLSLKFIFPLLIIVTLSAIFVFSVIHFIPQKFTGSFEYIRKGEELIDKGRYAQSIGYFQKACESSPDNDTIKSELVYAYSMYSDALAKQNKYDEAIEYLKKAYGLTPNLSTS